MCSIVSFLAQKRKSTTTENIHCLYDLHHLYRYFYSKTFKQILTCTELQRRTPVKITKRPAVGTKLDHNRVSRGYIISPVALVSKRKEDLCLSLRIQIGNLWWCFLCFRPCLHNHDRRENVLLRFCLLFEQSGSFWKTLRYDKACKSVTFQKKMRIMYVLMQTENIWKELRQSRHICSRSHNVLHPVHGSPTLSAS